MTQIGAAFACFHRLAIQNDRTGLTMSSFFFLRNAHGKYLFIRIQFASFRHSRKIVVHRFPRRRGRSERQAQPLHSNVEDRIENLHTRALFAGPCLVFALQKSIAQVCSVDYEI